MKLIYMAHPVRGDVQHNLVQAKTWLRHLVNKYNGTHTIIAPWITECELFDDGDEQQRAAGMQRCKVVIERCDEIWLVGHTGSPGMWQEARWAIAAGVGLVNMTGTHGGWGL